MAMCKTLNVHYSIKLDDGTEVDASPQGETVEMKIGCGELIEAFEDAIKDLKDGDVVDFRISPEDAYGPRRDELIQRFDTEDFPPGLDLEAGQQFAFQDQDGDIVRFTIEKVTDDGVYCDFNHPLAGKALNCHVEVVSVGEQEIEEE